MILSPPRILIAKAGLDGHDRGALLVCLALRDAGCEVLYTGIRNTPSQIVATAIGEIKPLEEVANLEAPPSLRRHFGHRRVS